ncbi:MAG: DUF2007 domain-containing protein [Marinobacter sp.]|nr:DUF2007 domain-containing protein [Marinobacter sp.]
MQIAYRARDITEAHIVAGFLEAHGIETHVGGHYLQGALGEIGTAGFSNVHVADDDFYRARDLVLEYEGDRPTSRVTTAREDKPDRYARWFLVALIVIVWLVIRID